MRLLFCCEFYFPSVGGVQEVMRQLAERLVRWGHDVTVATTRLEERTFSEHNGVKIVEFGVTGNLVRGMQGELERYRDFVASFPCDAILIKAAQQWTFDGLWPILDQLRARKVLIPCGFSGLFEPSYTQYFQSLPEILRKFDHLIFYAENYRDVNFARQHGISTFSILPNGASEIEFGVPPDSSFRRVHGIPEDSMVLLTVGSLTGVKGHKELLEAFVRLETRCRHVTFIMNGNPPPKPKVALTAPAITQTQDLPIVELPPSLLDRGMRIYRQEGIDGITKRITQRIQANVNRLRRVLTRIRSAGATLHYIWNNEGWLGVRLRLIQRLNSRLEQSRFQRYLPTRWRTLTNPIAFWMHEAQKNQKHKLLISADYPRDELVQAYMAADLFVFASNIEYSPLVLFESVAAGTPFLSVPVGNAEEIAKWTGGGMICPADKDERGYTRASPKVLAEEIAKAIENPKHLADLGHAGYEAWRNYYTWDAITKKYEMILKGDFSSLTLRETL